MRRVIRFSRLRLPFVILSGTIILTGVVLLLTKGINYGIDFRGGLNQQIQIAPAAMRLVATGSDSVTASSYSGERELLGGQAIQFVVVKGQDRKEYQFAYPEYATLSALAEACQTVPGVQATLVADGSLPTSRLFAVELPVDITKAPLVMNHSLAEGDQPYANIERVRAALTPLGGFEVQTLGSPTEQQFILKVAQPKDAAGDYRTQLESQVKTLLGAEFQADQVMIRKTDFVSPSLAVELASQTVSVILVALALMLVYLSFRFRFEYAFAIVLCVVHDSAVMFTAALALGLEFSTSVVAAILTIIGYSVNDTIVIFDRVREDMGLMRDTDETLIFDTALSQTLGRTLITSFVTLMAVVALYIFTSGSLKDFSFLLIVGIVVGSYSTIYIASPIVLLWHRIAKAAQRRREARKFGALPGAPAARPEPAADRRFETEGEVSQPVVADGATATPAPAAAAAAIVPMAAGGVVVRQQPSRKKKKRR